MIGPRVAKHVVWGGNIEQPCAGLVYKMEAGYQVLQSFAPKISQLL